MVSTAHIRGHKVYYNKEKQEWLYSDDDTSTSVERPCKRCGHMPLENGEDWCLGHIPKVKNACCGHGVEEGYIQLENGKSFREEFEISERIITKVEYEKTEDFHTIYLRNYYYGEKVSQVSIRGLNEDFDDNLRSIEKICKLENTLRKHEDKFNKIKLVLKEFDLK